MNEDILVSCERVSKRFCRSLKRSLWYGVKDIVKEFNPTTGATAVDGPPEDRRAAKAALRESEFWAVNDVSFELKRGECLGLIGHNGAGKTTLLKLLNGLIKPDFGRIRMRGRVGALIALGAGFNPILSGRENIYTNGLIKGLTRREIDSKIDEIIEFAEIAHAIDAPVRTFSSGMQARLGFAIAAHMNPDILLIDEVLAVGDISFRNKCLRFIEGVRSRGGGIILVTHSFNQVLSSCPKALLMDKGARVAFGSSPEVIDKALELQFEMEEDQPKSVIKESPRGVLKDDSGVRIAEYSFSGIEGEEILSGKPVKIEITVESEREIEGLFWSFSVWTQDGAQILVSKISSDSGLTWTLPKGRTVFRAVTGPLWLPPKRYSVRLGLAVGNRMLDLVGFERERIWIKVQSEEVSKSSIRTTVANDMVVMEVNWDPEFHRPEVVEPLTN